MKYIPNTPEGTRDRLFGECMERRSVQNQLTRVFRQRGYTEIMTPEMEYYDVFTLAGNNIPQENLTKVIDRSGKICVMRPDMTTPIARVAGTKLKDMVLPRRFFYNGHRLPLQHRQQGQQQRNPPVRHRADRCRRHQSGFGGYRCRCGVYEGLWSGEIPCGIGARRYLPPVLRPAGYGRGGDGEDALPHRGQELRRPERFPHPLRKARGLRRHQAPGFLFGGVEVLDEAEALQGGPTEVTAYLRTLYDTLCAAGFGDHVKFDLGMVHQLDYYTGVIFRGYAEGAGVAVLSGGRYDNLGHLLRPSRQSHRLRRGRGRPGVLPA